MRLGKKGFMLAEVVVVSVVIATVLVTLFVGLNRVSSAYELRNKYYDIDALYLSMEANDLLLANNFEKMFAYKRPQELVSNYCEIFTGSDGEVDVQSCYNGCYDEFDSKYYNEITEMVYCVENCDSEDYECQKNCVPDKFKQNVECADGCNAEDYECQKNCLPDELLKCVNDCDSDKEHYEENKEYYEEHCGPDGDKYLDFNTSELLKLKNNDEYNIRFYYAPYNEDDIASLKDLGDTNETFKDFIEYLSTSFDYNESKTMQEFNCEYYYKYFEVPPIMDMDYENDNRVVSSFLVNDLNVNNYTSQLIDIDYNDLGMGYFDNDNFYVYVFITEMCDKNNENCKYYGLKVGRSRICAYIKKEYPR